MILNTPVFHYANFKERFAACLLDTIIMWVLLAFLGNLLNEQPDHIFIGIVFSYKGTWLTVIAGWLYFAIQESSVHQGTIGKRIFKIQVVDTDGKRISFLKASGRYFAKYISYALLLLGFFMMLWDKYSRTLHDRICNTFVLKSKE
ncbi:RDD family protein [Taibaiella lutea]|uniref:RDD family protein n=1 Tax=Taibaiella lutea TaxID=2608001 RepID=A0A5M6CE70_9BACT|nr:RDD family protein [Taibaiella lutea]